MSSTKKEESTVISIYCVKCRKKVNPKDIEYGEVPFVTKTGKHASRSSMKATCPECGSKVRQFVSSKKKE